MQSCTKENISVCITNNSNWLSFYNWLMFINHDFKIVSEFSGFTRCHKFHLGSTPNRYTVIRLKKNFTVCVDLVFGSKYVQFREICLLQCSTIINTFWVDPHSELLKKVPVKPKNIGVACRIESRKSG